jgi:hypothetical protein
MSTKERTNMKTILKMLPAVFLAAASVAWADGVAFVTDVKGGVAIDGARPAVLAELANGARLSVAPDGVITVMYTATGKEFVLKGPGEYEVRATEVAASSGAKPTARTTEWRASNRVLAQVAQTSAASVRMRSLAKPKVAEPAPFPSEGNVASLQPTFRWAAPTPGSAEFTLLVDGYDKPVHSGKVVATSYRMPSKLKPDTEYYWRVTTGQDEVASGRFRTLPAETIRTVEARRPKAKAEFSDRLMFALLLQEMGAAQEARELWASLSQERTDLPELSALAK